MNEMKSGKAGQTPYFEDEAMNEMKSGKAGQTPYFEDEAMNEIKSGKAGQTWTADGDDRRFLSE